MRKTYVLTLLIALLGPSRIDAQSRAEVLRRAVWDTPGSDLRAVLTRPFENRRTTLLRSAALLGMLLTDKPTTRWYQDHLEPIGRDLKDQLQIPDLYPNSSWWGGLDGYAYTAVGGMYAVGALTGNVKLQEAGILTTKAILESYVVSHLFLKTLFARNRPNQPLEGGALEGPFTRDPWDFFNWHRPYFRSDPDGTAFPSWHFALYFTIAKTMQLHFDNAWIPYTLCMFPLVYEADGHRHWVSDMVVGAALGTLIGKVVYENYHAEGRGTEDRARPYSRSWSFGITPFYGRMAPTLHVSF